MTWFTADELARLFKWTPGYVRKVASVKGWRRKGRAPVAYHIEDVMQHRSTTRERGTCQDS